MQNMGRNIACWLALAATALLVACGGGGGGSPPAPTYTIGGNVTVTGGGALAPGLVLQVNAGDSLARSSTGTFTFATPVPSSTTYTVTVSTQPATQNCAVTNGSGTVGSTNVTNVGVACTPVPTRTVGGTINGLLGSGLELRLNGTSSFVTTATGTFSFTFSPLQVGEGNPYTVTVATQPAIPAQVCSVVNGTGTVAVGANVTNVAVNCALPTPRFAYAAAFSDNLVSAYTVNATTGSLTFIASVADGNTSPIAVTADPGGRFVLVASEGSSGANGAISAFAVNQTTGALSLIGSLTTGERPQAIAITPNRAFVYMAKFNGGVQAFRLNTNTAGNLVSLTSLGSIVAPGALNPTDAAVDPTGQYLYVTNGNSDTVTQFNISSVNGSLTVGSFTATGDGPLGVAIDPVGRFVYAVNVSANTVSGYTYSRATGALTATGAASPTGGGPSKVAIDPLGRFAYVANNTDATVSSYSIDPSTGVLTSLGAATVVASGVTSVTVDPSGTFLYVVNTGGSVAGRASVFEISQSAGTLTARGFITIGTNPRGIALSR